MPSYTLFALDPRSGRMDQFANYDANDDETAIDVAARFSTNRSTELWSRHRQVRAFNQAIQAVANRRERSSP